MAVTIPILNEAATLGATLRSLILQDYPAGLLEVIIVDGGSQDDWKHTLAILERSSIRFRVLANPARTTAVAVNLALSSTDAESILWISGHCTLSPGYVTAVVDAYNDDRTVVAGGRFDVRGDGPVGKLNAEILCSRFGTGMAAWRFDRAIGWTDAVTFALFDRQHLLELGGLDERLERNQDNDLVDRLKCEGTKFRRVDADAVYRAPETLRGLWRRAWSNGTWNLRCLRMGIGGISWWHFVPMAAVGLGGVLLALSVWSKVAIWVLMSLGAAYALMAVVYSFLALKRGPVWTVAVLPFMFLANHAIYGLGSWSGLFRPTPNKRMASV